PCKRMAKQVFTQKSVGDFYNKNFLNVKLDMEKGEGPRFAGQYNVRSYPTLLFIDGGGEIVHRQVGGQAPADFIKLGKTVVKKNDQSIEMAERYEEGKRDPDFVYKYIKALNKVDRPSLKVANDYLKTQDDYSTPFNQRFIFEAVADSDSRVFDLMIKEKKGILTKYSQEEFDDKIIRATNRTIDKAIKYESWDLVEEAKNKINFISDKERAELFHLRADKKYYLLTGDSKKYLKSAQKFVKEIAGKDAEMMHNMSREAIQYMSTDKKVLAKAEDWAAKAYSLEKNTTHAYTYVEFLYMNGNSAKALTIANEGIELCKTEKKNPRIFAGMMQKLELDAK
ncbi:MAG: thioredoxin family protein, partial [Saprospiraceae bacterium]